MKKWTILLLTAALLLQTACGDRPRISVADLTERTELELSQDLDAQKDYPAERPEIVTEPAEQQTEEGEEAPKKETAEPEQPSAEQNTPPAAEEASPTPAESQSETPPVQTELPSTETGKEETAQTGDTTRPQSQPDEVRAIWFSYFELETMLKGQSESAFTRNIGAAFDNVAALGLNTVIMQVRPYADAVYPSDYFPWSYLAAGEEGKDPGFDPLKIMVREAHNRGLSIEAWLNPYRVRSANYKNSLCDSNLVHTYLKSGDAVEYNGGIYFDPASKKAQKLIVDGVREIVANYNVDGIHFDDYFYPTTDESFDQDSYSAYKKQGGTLALADWRRQNVNDLVKAVYSAVHETKSGVRFGISPQGNLENNYNKQFIDVALWLSSPGYVDYICPQIYFGFENDTCPYAETVAQWNDLIQLSSVELTIGLAPFKIGTEDTWAGAGKNEWKDHSDLLSRMVCTAREASCYDGFVLFRYYSIFQPAAGVKSQIKTEIDNLKEVLQ